MSPESPAAKWAKSGYETTSTHNAEVFEEVNGEPETSVEIDGYVLPDEEAAKLFRKFKQNKIDNSIFAYCSTSTGEQVV